MKKTIILLMALFAAQSSPLTPTAELEPVPTVESSEKSDIHGTFKITHHDDLRAQERQEIVRKADKSTKSYIQPEPAGTFKITQSGGQVIQERKKSDPALTGKITDEIDESKRLNAQERQKIVKKYDKKNKDDAEEMYRREEDWRSTKKANH